MQMTVSTLIHLTDPNAELLHWLEVMHLHETVYARESVALVHVSMPRANVQKDVNIPHAEGNSSSSSSSNYNNNYNKVSQ